MCMSSRCMQFSFFGQLFLDAFHWLKENSAVMIWKQNKGGGWRNPLNVRIRGVWNFHCPPFSVVQSSHNPKPACVRYSVCYDERRTPCLSSLQLRGVSQRELLLYFPIPFFFSWRRERERRGEEGGEEIERERIHR